MPRGESIDLLRFQPFQVIFAMDCVVRNIQHTDWF
jgi:hypothetical protein